MQTHTDTDTPHTYTLTHTVTCQVLQCPQQWGRAEFVDKTHCTECTGSERRVNIFWNSGIAISGRLKSKTNPCNGAEHGCYPEKEDLESKETPRSLVGSSTLWASAKGVGLTPTKRPSGRSREGMGAIPPCPVRY